MSLTVILATRERPEYCAETVRNLLDHMWRADTKLLVCADWGDSPTLEALQKLPRDPRLLISISAREDSRGEKYGRALTHAPADLYLPFVDTNSIYTPNFDTMLVEAAETFPDGIGCVYLSMQNHNFPQHLAPTAGLVKRLGYIYSHDYPFWFIDHDLDDICRMIGRHFCLNIKIGAPRRGNGTLRLRDVEFWCDYYNKMTPARCRLAASIISDLEIPEWHKEMLLNSLCLVAYRSYGINRGVREHAKEIEAERGEQGPPDVGYLLAYNKAKAKLANEMSTHAQSYHINAG